MRQFRFDHIQLGNCGDHKRLGNSLFELRFFFSSGFRAYYTIKDGKVVFLLCGGDKSSQNKDINKARAIMAGSRGSIVTCRIILT